MIGSVIGDIVGSSYEGKKSFVFTNKSELFTKESRYTDDTILTIATISAILRKIDYKDAYIEYGKDYKQIGGFGSFFIKWLDSEEHEPYESWANGSSMRVSPIGFFYNNIDTVLLESKKSSVVTHNHPDSMDSAQAVASAVFFAKNGKSKKQIKKYLEKKFKLDFSNNLEYYIKNYKFDLTAKGTVVQALTAFFESTDFVSCIRNSVMMGGDTDTIACISGGIAEAFYKEIPEDVMDKALSLLPKIFIKIINNFYNKIEG